MARFYEFIALFVVVHLRTGAEALGRAYDGVMEWWRGAANACASNREG